MAALICKNSCQNARIREFSSIQYAFFSGKSFSQYAPKIGSQKNILVDVALDSKGNQGSDRIDSFWFANFWFAEVNQKLQIYFICDSLGRIILFLILIHFDSQCNLIFIHFDLRFNLILYILISDSILFYSFWFGFILFRRESRFTRESKIKSNQKSKVGESWFTHFRIMG